jgi:mannose-1-phosphate guanylyltransferase
VRAFLLAGGLGERLRPLTLTTPKCLVPVNGRPLLAYWLDLCGAEGVTDILVNVSQHPQQVFDFLARRAGPPRVQVVIESAPSGTAGIVAAQRAFVENEESFWVFYADNLTDVSLQDMLATHRRHDGLMTVGLFRAPVPEAAGIVELDAGGRIVGFEEKPPRPKGNLANGGIYVARRGVLDRIPTRPGVVDFGHDVLPALVGEIYGHVIEQFLMDIGTPSALASASEAWARHQGTRARA